MNRRTLLAVCAAVLALPATGLAAKRAVGSRGPAVTVRIEGASRTLLPTTTVRPGTGVVRKDGHSCSRASGAGALNNATRGAWSGKWFSGLGFEVLKILGETDNFTTTRSYWDLFVNNVASQVGICSVKLHPGEQLLFAAVPAKGTVYPLRLNVLSQPVAGRAFRVRVVFYDAKRKPHPLAGATVTATGIGREPLPNDRITAKTGSGGVATLTEQRSGLIQLGAGKRGYVRAASVARDVK
jgi:hypothetical protein